MEPIECRPSGEIWAAAVMSLIVGGFFGIVPVYCLSQPHDRDTAYLMGTSMVVGALFVGLAIYSVLYQCRACVVADHERLRWRGIGRWRSAAWGEVRDYYDRAVEKVDIATIEMESGKVAMRLSAWTNLAAFKTRVREKAERARAKDWGQQHCRPEDDWPRLFVYDVEKNRRAMWLVAGALVGLVLLPVALSLFKTGATRWGPGWQWSLAAFGLMELMVVLYAAVFVSVVRMHRDALRRKDERILVDLDGMTWEDDTRRERFVWSDIQGWKVGTRKGNGILGSYRIETATGTFEFTRCLQDATVLRQIITVRSGQQLRREDADEVLGAVGLPDDDRQLYSYRTRTNRALMLLPLSCACFSLVPFLLPLVLPPAQPPTAADTAFRVVAAGGLWLAALLLLANYRRSNIVLDRDGITQQGLFRSSTIAWEEIQSYAVHRDAFEGHAVVQGRAQEERVRFGLHIGNAGLLRAEIARRAVRSQTAGWNELQSSVSKNAHLKE
jgi:hypothetical protein